MNWKEVEIESDVSGDESESSSDESESAGSDDVADGEEAVIEPKAWNGIQAKTLRGILRKVHAYGTHLASLDDELADLGRIGHFEDPPAPAKGMALSRKVEGSIFEAALEG